VERNDRTLRSELDWTSEGLVALETGLIGFGLLTALVAVGLDNGSNLERWFTGLISLLYLGGGVLVATSPDAVARSTGILTAAIAVVVRWHSRYVTGKG
jgi:hypothetical protein